LSATRDFLGGNGPAFPALPFETEALLLTSERMLDGFVVLGVAVVLYGIGWALREFALPNFRPAVFALVCVGVGVFVTVNPVLWQIEKVAVGEEAVVCTYWSGEHVRIAWDEMSEVRMTDGYLFPMFLDDTMLTLESETGAVCEVPAFLSGSDEIAVVVGEYAED
jgi:hypothetical protein